MGALSQAAAIYFTLLVLMLYPFTQMSLYVADRHFYIVDVASGLYRHAQLTFLALGLSPTSSGLSVVP